MKTKTIILIIVICIVCTGGGAAGIYGIVYAVQNHRDNTADSQIVETTTIDPEPEEATEPALDYSQINYSALEDMMIDSVSGFVGASATFREYEDGIYFVDGFYTPSGVYCFNFSDNDLVKIMDVDYRGFDNATVTFVKNGYFCQTYNPDFSNNYDNYFYDFDTNDIEDTSSRIIERSDNHTYALEYKNDRDYLVVDGEIKSVDIENYYQGAFWEINGRAILCVYDDAVDMIENVKLCLLSDDCNSYEIIDEFSPSSFYATNKYLYYVKDNNVYQYDPASNTTNLYLEVDGTIGSLYCILGNRLYYVYQDRDENGFIGTATLYYADIETGESTVVAEELEFPLGGY